MPAAPSCVVALHANPRAALRLYAFAHAGGGASSYRTWPAHLPSDVELLAVQLPGRESRFREAPWREFSAALDGLTEELLPVVREPYAFFGHSVGALLAFELARSLAAHGCAPPQRLFVAAHNAPQLPSRLERTSDLPEDEFLRKLRKFNGTPAALLENREAMQLFLPTLRADFSLCETYVEHSPEPLPSAATVLGGATDPHTDAKSLDAWRERIAGDFRRVTLPGDHFFPQKLPRETVAEVVRDLLPALAGRG